MDVLQQMQIARLLYKVACDLDDRNLDEMEACFTEDASVTIEIASSGVSEPMKGRAALMELVRSRVAEQTDRRRHVISNILIDAEGPDRARASSFLTLIATEHGSARVLTTGRYRDVVVRHGDGWKIDQRRIELDLPY